jgi:hypothetical protein
MNFASNGLRQRSDACSGQWRFGQQGWLWVRLIQVFNDGHRLAKVLAVDNQIGHQVVCRNGTVFWELVLTLGQMDCDIFVGQTFQVKGYPNAK